MLWRLGEVGMASRIVRKKTNATAYENAIEIVEKIADVP